MPLAEQTAEELGKIRGFPGRERRKNEGSKPGHDHFPGPKAHERNPRPNGVRRPPVNQASPDLNPEDRVAMLTVSNRVALALERIADALEAANKREIANAHYSASSRSSGPRGPGREWGDAPGVTPAGEAPSKTVYVLDRQLQIKEARLNTLRARLDSGADQPEILAEFKTLKKEIRELNSRIEEVGQ